MLLVLILQMGKNTIGKTAELQQVYLLASKGCQSDIGVKRVTSMLRCRFASSGSNIKKSITFGLVLSCLSAQTALADKMVFACDLISTNAANNFFSQADQLVIDLEANSADLRVAKTMDTSEPVNWMFVTRLSELNDDVFKVKTVAGEISGGGVYGSAPHGFLLRSTGVLDWSFITTFYDRPVLNRWQCKR